jgi:hypothetical protein
VVVMEGAKNIIMGCGRGRCWLLRKLRYGGAVAVVIADRSWGDFVNRLVLQWSIW